MNARIECRKAEISISCGNIRNKVLVSWHGTKSADTESPTIEAVPIEEEQRTYIPCTNERKDRVQESRNIDFLRQHKKQSVSVVTRQK